MRDWGYSSEGAEGRGECGLQLPNATDIGPAGPVRCRPMHPSCSSSTGVGGRREGVVYSVCYREQQKWSSGCEQISYDE